MAEQLKAIKKELGMEKDENESEVEKIENAFHKLLPKVITFTPPPKGSHLIVGDDKFKEHDEFKSLSPLNTSLYCT